MRAEEPDVDGCDHASVLAERYHLGPVLRSSPGTCAHRGYDDLLQRTVVVTLLAGRGPLVLPPRAWLDRGPEVAELFDAGDVDDRLFLVTQHPAEPTLAETTPPGGLDSAQVRALGAAIADTLIPRHRHGAAHGGLGADTVAWTPRGASLAEFGLLPWLERSGELPVTPPFPAPEREIGAPHQPAGDVYALGRLLDELAPARRRRGLRELLAEMTADSPADRPTMEEVARRLSGLPAGMTRAALERHGRTAALVAAACCLVVLGVGFSAFGGSTPSAPGATLAITAAAPVVPVAPLPVLPAAPSVSGVTAPASSSGSSTGSDEAVVAVAPSSVRTTRAAEPTRDATRAAAWRDDGSDRPSSSAARPTTSATPTTTAEPTRTTEPTKTSEPTGTSKPTKEPDEDPESDKGSGHRSHGVRDALDRAPSSSGHHDGSDHDGDDDSRES